MYLVYQIANRRFSAASSHARKGWRRKEGVRGSGGSSCFVRTFKAASASGGEKILRARAPGGREARVAKRPIRNLITYLLIIAGRLVPYISHCSPAKLKVN
jgi:hypothetical protein